MSRRRTWRRWRPDCSSVILALVVTAAGAWVVARAVLAWLGNHPVFVAGVVAAVALGVPAARRGRGTGAPAAPTVDMAHLSPGDFEHAVAALCRRDGCRGVQVVGGAGDLGADVLATLPDGRRMLIQCKRYAPGRRVGSPDVQRVGGTYSIVHHADIALVVTTAGYTEAAADYASRAGIGLVDGVQLDQWARGGLPPWR